MQDWFFKNLSNESERNFVHCALWAVDDRHRGIASKYTQPCNHPDDAHQAVYICRNDQSPSCANLYEHEARLPDKSPQITTLGKSACSNMPPGPRPPTSIGSSLSIGTLNMEEWKQVGSSELRWFSSSASASAITAEQGERAQEAEAGTTRDAQFNINISI